MSENPRPTGYYTTRSKKVSELEEGNKLDKNGRQLTHKCQSPAALSRRVCKPQFGSPSSQRPNTLTFSQNDNEVEWDLTSPSALKYQVLLSDKKTTSTPNNRATPSRTQRRRLPSCKKNIAKGATTSSSLNLFNELAALNDLVNSEHQTSRQCGNSAQTLLAPRALGECCSSQGIRLFES